MGLIADSARLCELSYVVVDTETTGTSHGQGDRLTEFAAVVVREGAPSTEFSTLLDPECFIPPYITRLTGISQDMVDDAPRFRDVCDDIRGLFGGPSVFVAHNAPFDWGFVNMEFSRVGEPPLLNDRLCTVRLARRLLPHLPRRSLDHVTAHFGIRVEHRHRALGDALATAQVLRHLLQRAYELGADTWEDLDHLLHPGTVRARKRSALPGSVTDFNIA